MRKSLHSTTTFLTRLGVFTLFGLAILIGLAAFQVQVQAATLTVTKTADTNDLSCDADCSLREAIGAALPGDTVIVPAGTYTLTLGTEIFIDTDLTLTGAGEGVTIIEAATQPGVANRGVFEVLIFNDVTISGVTIRHGNTPFNGGGIQNSGTLTVTSSTISNNSAGGGGIFTEGTTTVKKSTISNNSSAVLGGGIFSDLALTVTHSTISNNSANNDGGGIASFGALTVTNSTISNNSAGSDGGGISNADRLTVTNSTISNNSAAGGGISDSSNRTVLINTIIAGNVPGGDCSGGVLSLGVNLDSDDTCNLSPVFLTFLAPTLCSVPLQDNGGPTETHALLPGSPAIGVGEPCSLATDQRGVLREQGVGCDIGAFEVGPVPRCNLDLRLEYDGSNLSLGFDLATQDPALWDVRLVSIFGLTNLWSAPVPVVDPPVFLPVEFPFPNIGNIGIVTTLTTAEGGIPCADVEIVDTGGLGPSREELENLVEQSGVFGDGGGR